MLRAPLATGWGSTMPRPATTRPPRAPRRSAAPGDGGAPSTAGSAGDAESAAAERRARLAETLAALRRENALLKATVRSVLGPDTAAAPTASDAGGNAAAAAAVGSSTSSAGEVAAAGLDSTTSAAAPPADPQTQQQQQQQQQQAPTAPPAPIRRAPSAPTSAAAIPSGWGQGGVVQIKAPPPPPGMAGPSLQQAGPSTQSVSSEAAAGAASPTHPASPAPAPPSTAAIQVSGTDKAPAAPSAPPPVPAASAPSPPAAKTAAAPSSTAAAASAAAAPPKTAEGKAAAPPAAPAVPPPPPSVGPSAWGRPVTEPLAPMEAGPRHDTRRRAAAQATAPLSIVFCAAEVAPWSKTGGLGDVIGALPPALVARGNKVMVVAPRYTNGGADIRRYAGLQEAPTESGRPVRVQAGGREHELKFWYRPAAEGDGVDWVFVGHEVFERKGTPYGDANGAFEDNLFRFSLLSLAALEAPLQLTIGPGNRPYGEDVVFVANDWHAAFLPVFLRTRFQPGGVFTRASCALAIHNLAHQGVAPSNAFNGLSLPGAAYSMLEWRPPQRAGAAHVHQEPTLNVLKAGIVAADALVTVSPSYAAEVVSTPQANGMDTLLAPRRAALRGIVNGIDIEEWKPATDLHLPAKYSSRDLSGKAACKRALQREMRLPVDPSAPLIGFIGRLDYQKGPDLVLEALAPLASMGCQVVMLGSGAPDYEAALQEATRSMGFFFRAHVGFSVPLAHRVIAGADILLMPSRFEPCGLNQLYAMRYGTVPVAHATGGLADTIDDVDAFGGDEGTGWTFSPATPEALADAVGAAVRCYRERPADWTALVSRCMAADWGWDGAAGKYEKVLTAMAAQRQQQIAPAAV